MTPEWRRLFAAVVVVLIAAALLTGTGTGSGENAPPGQEELDDADSVLISIEVTEDGDAEWWVEYRYALDDNTTRTAFENLSADIEDEPDSYASRFREGIVGSAETAAQNTGREMTISEVTIETGTDPIPQADGRHGTISYQFTWEGFADAQGDSLEVGDAIHGFYLSPETTLLVSWPQSYELMEVRPTAENERDDRITWEGEMRFGSDEPAIRLGKTTEQDTENPDQDDGQSGSEDQPDESTEDGGTPPTDADGGGGTPATEGDGDGGLPMLVLAVAAVLMLGVVGTGGFVVLRRYETKEDSDLEAENAEQRPPPDLMSNEERVLTALEDHGGRMKQKELAEECDWHASKTSKVVNGLKEDDAIEVFRLGRENILTLPDHTLDPTEQGGENRDS